MREDFLQDRAEDGKMAYYFSYPFVRYALAAVLLISLCSALLGVSLVLRRYSMIGDGLSHVAFGAMAVGVVASVSNTMLVTMPLTILAAVLILRAGHKHGDSSVAVISVSALAVGYLLLSAFGTSANISGDVCSSLFGSATILTLSLSDVWVCIGLCAAVILFFVLFYNKLFAVTFDEDFARACGVNTELYNLALAVITAVVIVVAMKLVGALLISALIVFPALSAMSLFKSFFRVTVASCIISVVCAVAGVLISLAASTPVGPTVVVCDLVVFIIFNILGKTVFTYN